VDSDRAGRLARLDGAADLDHPLARNQNAGRELGPTRQRPGHLGQPVTVGRDHPGGGAVGFEQHAGQVLAGLVQRDGEDRLGDHLAQHRRVDLEDLGLLDRRKLRVVAIRHPDHLELDLPGADLGPVLFRPAHAHSSSGSP
jgi:hypothetical protein